MVNVNHNHHSHTAPFGRSFLAGANAGDHSWGAHRPPAPPRPSGPHQERLRSPPPSGCSDWPPKAAGRTEPGLPQRRREVSCPLVFREIAPRGLRAQGNGVNGWRWSTVTSGPSVSSVASGLTAVEGDAPPDRLVSASRPEQTSHLQFQLTTRTPLSSAHRGSDRHPGRHPGPPGTHRRGPLW